MKLIPRIWIFILILMCSNVLSVCSKAPRTAKIAFGSYRDRNPEVYLMNPDGSQAVNLTRNGAADNFPTWSPTGEQILFVSDRDGMRDLYLMDADGSNVRRVFKKIAERGYPTWAPDGKQIAYQRGDIIYIATLGKQTEEHLVSGFHPAWSPDGTEIVFASDVFGSHRLTVINIRTGRQKKLLPENARAWQQWPAWSPRGDRIAFSWLNHVLPHGFIHDLVDKETIYIVNRDGTGLERIVDETGPKANYPVWSPDGNKLLYTQESDDQFQIFKIDLASRTPKQLTHVKGIFNWGNFHGDWFDPATLSVPLQPQLLSTIWGEVKRRDGP